MTTRIQNVQRNATRLWPVTVLLISLFAEQNARADVLALWAFEDVLSATGVADNLTAGNVTISSGSIGYQAGTDDGGTKIGNASSWSQTDFSTAGKYIQFSVAPANGYDVHVTEVTIRLGRTGTGPTLFTAQYSLDGFATAGTSAGTGTISSDNTSALDSFTLSVPANAQAGTVTYRVWGHNAGTGNMRFNNFRLYGNVNSQLPVPVVSAASVTNVTGFTAAWSAVSGANGYRLDVSKYATFTEPGGIVFEIDFDGVYPPVGWTEFETEQATTYKRSGMYSSRLGAANDYLITPLINAASTLGFWSYTTSTDPSIVVEYADVIAGPWTAFPESPFSGNTDQWNERSIDMDGHTDVYVRFKKSGTGTLYVEDVVVTDPDVPSFVSGYQSRTIADGSTTSASVTGLVSNSEYFYRVRATNDISTSANSTTESVTTLASTVLKAEPSNHATDFRATVTTHRTIVLEWTDAAGGEVPDGYIVRGSINGYADISDPVDGIGISNLLTWSPRYAQEVDQGTQVNELRGLTAGTTYYFKIFPMTGSGVESDYKTDGVVPQIAVTTGAAPFEDFEDKSKTEYALGSVAFKSGSWSLDNALLGGALGERKEDQLSVRIINQGSLTMLFDVTDVETVSLEHANFGTDTGGKFVVERSIDGGVNWHPIGAEVVCSGTLQTATFTVHRLAASRLRIRKTAVASDTSRINIDNIRFTPFEHEGSVFRFH